MPRACLLVCVVFATYSAAANPPDEDVLRPSIPSEGQLYIEPHAGVNFTFLSADSLRSSDPSEGNLDIYRSAFGIAPLVGVTVGYQFSPTIGAEFDLSLDSRNAENSGTSLDDCVIRDSTGAVIRNELIPVEKDYTVFVSYLSLGLAWTFSVEDVFFVVGPTASIPVSSKVEESNFIASDETVCRYFIGAPDATRTIVGTLSGADAATHISIRLGAGYRIRVGDRMELVPRVSYDFGLTDTFTGNGVITYRNPAVVLGSSATTALDDNSMQLNALQASLGLRITL